MARRALQRDDVVAACAHKPGRQAHFADRLDQREALKHGVLLPHRKYVVTHAYRKGEGRTSPKRLLVCMVGDERAPLGDERVPRVSVRPSEVRLWSNPQERKWRREHPAEEPALRWAVPL